MHDHRGADRELAVALVPQKRQLEARRRLIRLALEVNRRTQRRLTAIAGDLGHELDRGDARRGGQVQFVGDAAAQRLAEAAERIPVIVYSRPERGVILNATYGYRASEADLRETKVIPAGFLSPQAARMKLLACLASGLNVEEIRWAFGQDDG